MGWSEIRVAILDPQLTWKTRLAYTVMSNEDAQDYDRVKTAIYQCYDISEEIYWRRLWMVKPKENNTPIELVTVWRETLMLWKFGEIDNWPKFSKFSLSKLLHIYNKVSCECNSIILPPLFKNIEQFKDTFLGTRPTTCRVPSIVFLIAMACRSCKYFLFLVHKVSLHLPKDYPIYIGSHGSLKPLNLYKTCKLSFHTLIAHN